ncbi:hypothetical protein HOLleu_31498 [Holothuria leucospilota]|uniref:Uncharacterized protein n=1 Tax=Holothuria leucospilota TaxID=206669 RepID=A0A9Q1BIE3_HOLLE|nr:hypothetical protein HOLleu_31498 [Holothuria leucospilota]
MPFNHNMSHVLEETTFDETFDYQNGSAVFSPGGTFHVSTEYFDGVPLPRTSSPIQPNLPKYTDEEKREIWRRRVLLKKPILFTYRNHRHPKKSYKYLHRQLQRRRIKIDDPRCRTPTPTALKTSWTRFEDVIKNLTFFVSIFFTQREGILSSPAHIEFIEFDSNFAHSKHDAAGCAGIKDVSRDDLGGVQNISDEISNAFSSSSDSFKALQQEIVNKVKRDIAEDNVPPNFKQADEGKDGRSYWDRVMKTRRSYVSQRTPHFKLARKKAQLLRSGLMNLLSPSSESEETTSPEYNLRKCRVNPNYNRNASGISSEDSSAFLDKSCRPLSQNSSTMSANSSVYDVEDERMKNQNSEQFQIPVVEPSCRRIPQKGKREYHALDEIFEHDEEDPGYQGKDDQNPSTEMTSLHRSWSSNPNLIIIVPENTNTLVNPTEKHPKPRRSNSSPNIKSLTPPILEENEAHLKSNLKGTRYDASSSLNGGKDFCHDPNFKDQTKATDYIYFQDKKKRQTIASDAEMVSRESEARHRTHVRREFPNSVNIENETIADTVNTTNTYHSNIVTTERINGKTGERFLCNGAKDCKVDYGNPDRDQNLPQNQKHLETELNGGPYDKAGVYYNNSRRQDAQQKPQQFQKCHDPSFRGFGLNDKYHYYKHTNNANAQKPGGNKILKGACGPGNFQIENQKTREPRSGPLDHQPTQKNSYEQWRTDHLAHGTNPNCPCYDCDTNCNRYNAQTTRMHIQPFPEGTRSNGENVQVNDITQDANRPNARSGRPPQQMPYLRNEHLLPRGPQCPPHGNVRLPYRRPFQFCRPAGPFRRMPPPVGVPLPPSFRFAMRRPPFLGVIPTHFPPPCRFPILLPPMPQRVPRIFP